MPHQCLAHNKQPAKKTIVTNVKSCIHTFGKDFTFMGNQVHIDNFGHGHWVDLLLFNSELLYLVVFELKKGAFKPANLDQLSVYIRISMMMSASLMKA